MRSVAPPDGRSRREFLRATLVGTAAAAAVVGGGTALAASVGPRVTSQILPGTSQGSPPPVCVDLAEASHGSNANSFLEVTGPDAATLLAGGPNPCIIVHDKRTPPHIADLLTTVVCHMTKQNSTHILLGICPIQTDVFPAGSSVCISSGCPPSDTCGAPPC